MRSFLSVLAFILFALLPFPSLSQSTSGTTPTAYHLKIDASDLDISDSFSASVLVNVTIDSSDSPKSLVLNSVNLTIDKVSIVVMGKRKFSQKWQVQPISDVSVNETNTDVSFISPLPSGDYSIYIEYKGYYQSTMAGFAKVGYNFKGLQKYLGITGLEPTNARKVFPCYDQPGFKTAFVLEITLNKPLAAVSLIRPTVHSASNKTKRVYVFSDFPSMPIYQMGWACLDQTSYPVRENNLTSPMIHTRAPNIYMNQTLYANKLTGHLVQTVESFTGIQFSQTITQNASKIEQIVLPEFFIGTSEGYGFMSFSEDSILVSPNKSSTKSVQDVSLILCRSMMQQWFGNIISTNTWSNSWLMKGINQFLQYVIATSLPEMSDWELEDQAVPEMTQPALFLDSLPNSHPLTFYSEDETYLVSKVSDDLTKYKGGAIIRMLKDVFGSSFNEAMNLYFTTSFSNPELNPGSPQDFWNLLYGVAADQNIDLGNQALSQIMDQWTNAPGYPVLSVTSNSTHFIISQSNSSLWWVPVTYSLEGSPNVNRKWLQPGSFFTVPASSATWILININQTGFYRVNYTEELWQKHSSQLSTDMTLVPRLSRAQLIDDLFHLNTVLALDATKYLLAETDYFPWATSLHRYKTLIHSMNGHSSYQLLKNYALDLMKGIIAEVGFSPKPQDTHIDKLKRSLVLEKACEFGHQTCIQRAVTYLQMWMAKTYYDPDVSTVLLCAGVGNSSTDVWQSVWSMYQYSIFPSVRLALLKSLTCTYDEGLLNEFLNNITSTIEPVVSLKDKMILLQTLASKPFGARVLLNWLVDRLQAQVNRTEASTPMPQSSSPASITVTPDTSSVKPTDQPINKSVATSPMPITVTPLEKLPESDVNTILALILPMLTTLDDGTKLDSFLTLGNETGLSNSTLETMKAAIQQIYMQSDQAMKLNAKLVVWLEADAVTTTQAGESTNPSTQTEPPRSTQTPNGTPSLTSAATNALLWLLALCLQIHTML